MINLLPDDRKREIRAARANVILLQYNFLTLAVAGTIVALCAFYYIFLHSTQSDAVSTNSDNSSIAASYADVRKQAEEYRGNLAIASKILANGVNYTTIIFSITDLLPEGVVLDSINLNAANFDKQMVFAAHAKSYDEATKLKQNFQNSKLFSNVFFQSLADEESGTSGGYPIAVTLSAKLKKEAL